ncbi:hypothetical protein AAA533_06530 [Pseudomonas aeruginosa]|uniref:hypothetical protein n=1 Tax=Pseudomonas aeruginosa TaxID=287 RepID=UPI002902ADF6|nr:hypothetical protein [Pseudomonas aeruginosa]MDU0637395.1 hypothetical protein [Pseudomonas aeruginosa]
MTSSKPDSSVGRLASKSQATYVGVVKSFTLGAEIGGINDYITFILVDLDGREYPCFMKKFQLNHPAIPGIVTTLAVSINYCLNVTAAVGGDDVQGYHPVLSITLNTPD